MGTSRTQCPYEASSLSPCWGQSRLGPSYPWARLGAASVRTEGVRLWEDAGSQRVRAGHTPGGTPWGHRSLVPSLSSPGGGHWEPSTPAFGKPRSLAPWSPVVTAGPGALLAGALVGPGGWQWCALRPAPVGLGPGSPDPPEGGRQVSRWPGDLGPPPARAPAAGRAWACCACPRGPGCLPEARPGRCRCAVSREGRRLGDGARRPVQDRPPSSVPV